MYPVGGTTSSHWSMISSGRRPPPVPLCAQVFGDLAVVGWAQCRVVMPASGMRPRFRWFVTVEVAAFENAATSVVVHHSALGSGPDATCMYRTPRSLDWITRRRLVEPRPPQS